MYDNLAATMTLVKSIAGNRLAPGVASFLDLFDAGAVFEKPYKADGSSLRLEGKDHIARYMRNTENQVFLEGMQAKEVHQFGDADGIVVEYDGTIRLVATGRRFRQQYISILLFRHGRVSPFREYSDPLASRETN